MPVPTTVPEVVDRAVIVNQDGKPVEVQAAVAPTQMRYPWKTTLRTAFQMVVALATLIPFIVAGIYSDPDAYPAVVVQIVGVAGAVARVMALPQVEAFLRRFAPWLAAAAAPSN